MLDPIRLAIITEWIKNAKSLIATIKTDCQSLEVMLKDNTFANEEYIKTQLAHLTTYIHQFVTLENRIPNLCALSLNFETLECYYLLNAYCLYLARLTGNTNESRSAYFFICMDLCINLKKRLLDIYQINTTNYKHVLHNIGIQAESLEVIGFSHEQHAHLLTMSNNFHDACTHFTVALDYHHEAMKINSTLQYKIFNLTTNLLRNIVFVTLGDKSYKKLDLQIKLYLIGARYFSEAIKYITEYEHLSAQKQLYEDTIKYLAGLANLIRKCACERRFAECLELIEASLNVLNFEPVRQLFYEEPEYTNTLDILITTHVHSLTDAYFTTNGNIAKFDENELKQTVIKDLQRLPLLLSLLPNNYVYPRGVESITKMLKRIIQQIVVNDFPIGGFYLKMQECYAKAHYEEGDYTTALNTFTDTLVFLDKFCSSRTWYSSRRHVFCYHIACCNYALAVQNNKLGNTPESISFAKNALVEFKQLIGVPVPVFENINKYIEKLDDLIKKISSENTEDEKQLSSLKL